MDDFIWRKGQGAQKFSDKDDIIGYKKGGAIDNLLGSSNAHLSEIEKILLAGFNQMVGAVGELIQTVDEKEMGGNTIISQQDGGMPQQTLGTAKGVRNGRNKFRQSMGLAHA
jgi:hypothetical protein